MNFQCQECFELFEESLTLCSICGSEAIVPVDSITEYYNWEDDY